MSDRSIRTILRADYSAYRRDMDAAAATTDRAAKRMGGSIEKASRRGILSLRTLSTSFVGLGIAKVVKDSVNLEAAYSKTLAQIKVAAGATGDEMRKLDALAIKQGKDTVFSAKQSADAMLELAKGGLTPAQIRAGALANSLTLATAGSLELDQAADAVVNTMGAFHLRAADSERAVNALAGAANATSAGVNDMTEALAQSSASAHAVGLSVEETTALLAALAQNGIKGSDAGTSLKTALQRLQPVTKKQRDEMKALGLSFVDANGNFVGAVEIAGRLQRALADLTPAQRTAAVNTIFGSDAQRAANILANEGAAGISKLLKATSDQTQAQKLSQAAMSGTAGALEKLKGNVETAELQLGKGLAPTVRDLSDDLSDLIESGDFEKWGRKIGDGLEDFLDVAGPLAKDTLPLMGDALKTVRDVGVPIAGIVGDIAKAFDKLPDGVKELALAGGGLALAKRKLGSSLGGGLAGGLGAVVSKASPIPVFVTNPGFGGPGIPGAGGPGGRTPGVPPVITKGAPVGEAGFKGWLGNLAKGGKFAALLDPPALMTLGQAGNEVLPAHPPGAKILSSNELLVLEAKRKSTEETKRQIAAQKALNALLLGPALPQYGKMLASLPAEVQTAIATPGAVESLTDVSALAEKYKLTPKQVRTVVALMGAEGALGNVRELGRLYGLTPKQVRTFIEQAGMDSSTSAIRRLAREYHLTPAQVRTLIKLDGADGALVALARIGREIRSIPRRWSTTYYVNQVGGFNKSGQNFDPRHGTGADGATVPKTGKGYADRHLYLLADGEEVVSDRRGGATRNRAALKAASRGATLAVVGGLADGGTAVRPPSIGSAAHSGGLPMIGPAVHASRPDTLASVIRDLQHFLDAHEKLSKAERARIEKKVDRLGDLKQALAGFSLADALPMPEPKNPIWAGVRDSLRDLEKDVRSAGGRWTKADRQQASSILKNAHELDRLTKNLPKLSDRVDAAKSALDDLQSSAASLSSSVAGQFTGSPFEIPTEWTGPEAAGGIAAPVLQALDRNLTAQTNQADQLLKDLQTLADEGLSKDFLTALATNGDAGFATAHSLASATPEVVAGFNAQFIGRGQSAAAVGSFLSDTVFGQSIAAAQSDYAQAQTDYTHAQGQIDQLATLVNQMGNNLVKGIKVQVIYDGKGFKAKVYSDVASTSQTKKRHNGKSGLAA